MKYKKAPILCGSTFFFLMTLDLASKQTSSYRYGETAEGITEPEMLYNWIGITKDNKPVHFYGVIDTAISGYKNCRVDTISCVKMQSALFIEETKANLSNKDDILGKIHVFIDVFIKSRNAAALLCKRLISIVLDDETIPENAEFYMNDDLSPIKKADLRTKESINVEAALFGIWYYIISNRISNEAAKDNFDLLFAKAGIGKTKRFFNETEFVYNKQAEKEFFFLPDPEKDVKEINPEPENKKEKKAVKKVPFPYYANYITNACDKIENIRTILSPKEDIKFYSVYVCNDVWLDLPPEKAKTVKNPILIKTTPQKLVNQYGRFITLTSPGGVGKSMFLRHLMLCDNELSKRIPEYEPYPVVPVLIKLKDYSNKYTSLEEFFFSRMKKHDLALDFNVFKEDLNRGIFMFLLDALDELDTDFVNDFISSFNDFAEEYDSNIFVLSSRPSTACESLTNFKSLELRGFRQEQALQLVDKFDGIDDDAKEKFKKQININGVRKYSKFSVEDNPLLLTIKYMVYRDTGKIIENEVYEFFNTAYETLFQTHDVLHSQYSKRKYKVSPDMDILRLVISEFCFITYMNFKYSFTRTEIEETIDKMKLQHKYGFTAQQFIEDLRDNLSIISFESGKYSFIHKSFQEYFAAYHLYKARKDFFTEDLLTRIDKYSHMRFQKDVQFDIEHGTISFPFYDCEIINVIEMFHQMNPEKAEEFLFFPILSKIFMDTEFDINILCYIYIAYGRIECYVGNVGNAPINDQLRSEIIHYLLWNVVDVWDDHEIECEPPEGSFVSEYWYYNPEEKSIEPANDLLEDFDEELGVIKIDPEGITYSIPDMHLIEANYEKNKDFINVLVNDFNNEYQSMLKYWDSTIKKYYKKPASE